MRSKPVSRSPSPVSLLILLSGPVLPQHDQVGVVLADVGLNEFAALECGCVDRDGQQDLGKLRGFALNAWDFDKYGVPH
jgi:hypothetical protein